MEGQTELSVGEIGHYKKVITAVLFAMGGSVEAPELAKACGCDLKTARKAAQSLAEEYEALDGPLLVRELSGSFQMCSNPKYYPNLIRLLTSPKKPVLTDVVLETLSIIAFKYPVTKLEIEKIRGVKSDHAVNRLIEFGLVRECGRLDAPGRPALFEPTDEFYRRFGVSGKEDLPRVGEEKLMQFREEVQAELKEAFGETVALTEPETEAFTPEEALELPEEDAPGRQAEESEAASEGETPEAENRQTGEEHAENR